MARMGHAPVGRLSYTRWALVFTGVSLLISNVGLSLISALAVPVLELVRVTGGPCRPLAEWIGTWLPLYRYGLGWTVPAMCGFVVGLILRRTGGKAA